MLILGSTAGPPPFLSEGAALVVAAAAVAYLGFRLGLVPIVGFLLAGVAIGPHALGLVRDRAMVDAAAEIGVILLLFTIGIEFSLERLARVARLIFVGGGLQVVLATGATLGLLTLLGVGWREALYTGLLVSLSSTAIVLKLLGDRGRLGAPEGQAATGVLVFQDIAVVIMVLLVPVLGDAGGEGGLATLGGALLRAGLVVAAALLGARWLMPRLLEPVARTCSPEIFLLTVVAVCFGTAWLASLAGVSVSLGAFLAGLVVSESRFSHQAVSDILPLQILFSASFFVSVGMLLDLDFLVRNLLLVLLSVVAVVVLKTVSTALALLPVGFRPLPAAGVGLMLAQVGEFSFVLEGSGRAAGLTPAGMGDVGSQCFISATVLLMVLTPPLARAGFRLAEAADVAGDSGEEVEEHGPLPHLEGHVVVAGHGPTARRLLGPLAEAGIPHVLTTLSPHGAAEARERGVPVLLGDISRRHIQELAGVDRARLLILPDDEPERGGYLVQALRPLNPSLRIVIHTRSIADAESLAAAGADRVVVEEVEGAVALLEEVLDAAARPPEEVGARRAAMRAEALEGPARFAPPRVDPSVCAHAQRARSMAPATEGCEECLRSGDKWVHLRLCMACGHVGCCDSSPNRHADAHWRATGHPLIRSLEPGEDWFWCYADEKRL